MAATLTFWGTRGSLPVSGPSTARTGGNTSCVTLESAGAPLTVLDAGTGIRSLGAALGERPLAQAHLLLSHTHWDHIQGLPFFAPLWQAGTSLSIIGPRPERASLASVLERQMEADVFPVPFTQFAAPPEVREIAAEALELSGLAVKPFRLHHPGTTFGYRLERGGMRSVAYVTDNELTPGPAVGPGWRRDLASWLGGVHTMIHDTMYRQDELPARHGWGHSSPDEAIALAAEVGASRLVLFHHDPSRSDDALDAILVDARRHAGRIAPALEVLVAYDTLSLEL